jgi:hypothetical protein
MDFNMKEIGRTIKCKDLEKKFIQMVVFMKEPSLIVKKKVKALSTLAMEKSIEENS